MKNVIVNNIGIDRCLMSLVVVRGKTSVANYRFF